MPKTISMLTTIKGSLLEKFYPKGWNLKKIDACCQMNLQQLTAPKRWWDQAFKPVPVESVKRHDASRGRMIAKAHAEAFVQHRGHAYPPDDLLATLFQPRSGDKK